MSLKWASVCNAIDIKQVAEAQCVSRSTQWHAFEGRDTQHSCDDPMTMKRKDSKNLIMLNHSPTSYMSRSVSIASFFGVVIPFAFNFGIIYSKPRPDNHESIYRISIWFSYTNTKKTKFPAGNWHYACTEATTSSSVLLIVAEMLQRKLIVSCVENLQHIDIIEWLYIVQCGVHQKNHVVSREKNYPVQEMTVSYKVRIRVNAIIKPLNICTTFRSHFCCATSTQCRLMLHALRMSFHDECCTWIEVFEDDNWS